MINRRIDPEQVGAVNWPHVWRSLRVMSKCAPVAGWPWSQKREEWSNDSGYCLDRFSTRAELADIEAE